MSAQYVSMPWQQYYQTKWWAYPRYIDRHDSKNSIDSECSTVSGYSGSPPHSHYMASPMMRCGINGVPMHDNMGGVPPAMPFGNHGDTASIADINQLKQALSAARPGQIREIICSAKFKPREQAYTSLIQLCGKQKSWEKAVEVFETMKALRSVHQLTVNKYTYSALIAACGSCGEWERAFHYFQEMLQVAESNPDCVPNHVTYSALITACMRGGRLDKALEVYQQLQASGVSPDDITYSAIICACEKHDQWDEVEQIVDRMHRDGFTASPTTYNALIAYHAKTCNWQKALERFLQMQFAGHVPGTMTCRCLMEAFSKAGQSKMALELLSAMQDSGMPIHKEVLHLAIASFSVSGEWSQLKLFLEQWIATADIDASLFQLLLAELSQNADAHAHLDGTVELLRQRATASPSPPSTPDEGSR